MYEKAFQLYGAGLAAYVILHLVGMIIGTTTRGFAFVRRLILWHFVVGSVGVGLYQGFLNYS